MSSPRPWRAGLLVFGLLAVGAALILATRGDDEPERVVLRGKTSRGQAIALVFHDGRLHSARTRAPVYCPVARVWRSVRWRPVNGLFGVFEQEGPRFAVRQRADARRTASKRPVVTLLEMRGRLDDHGESARGAIHARWESERSRCRATVRFRAG